MINELKQITFNQYSSDDPDLIEKMKNNRKAIYAKLKKIIEIGIKKDKINRKVFDRLDEK